MKFVYILGLEHSGSTLTNHLLSHHSQVLGLGEVTSFFSSSHMSQYMAKWGHLPDAKLCSCGQYWEFCDFWKHLNHLNGLYSSYPLIEKYNQLIQFIETNYGKDAVIVDSSKNLQTLKLLHSHHKNLGFSSEDFFIIFTVKDVRSFAASIGRKTEKRPTLLSTLRTFNWWLSDCNRAMQFLEKDKQKFYVNLYEKLCLDPDKFISRILTKLNLDSKKKMDTPNKNLHIAMGNKNFINKGMGKVKYDIQWFNSENINLAYLLHWKAKKLNKTIYQITLLDKD